MSLNTDLNVSPYYDDFDETKNFHRVLFKPGVALQARELTQLQSILQNQIERFGDNVLIEGTIIQGCNFTEVPDLAYVKILDLNTNGQPVPMNNYVGAKVVGASTEVTAIVVDIAEGLESQTPNLNTLFVKYTGTSADSTLKTFDPSENLEIRYIGNNALIDTVTSAGSALNIASEAIGDSYGVKVSDGIIYQKGFFVKIDAQLAIVSKYTNAPTDVVVGFQTAETIVNSNIDDSLLDNAYGYNNYQAPGADRIVLTPSLVVLTKTAAQDDETFFAIQEYMYGKVVRRNLGTQYNGIMNIIEQRSKEEFGNYIIKDFVIDTSNSTDSMVASAVTVGKSYIITDLGTPATDFTLIGSTANTVGTIFTATGVGTGAGEVVLDAVDLNIGKGLAYVEGKRVELLDRISVDLPKSDQYSTESAQSITTNYGNYVLVKECMGYFDFNKGATVNLFDTVQTNVTDGVIGSNSGISIGTAKVMSVEYDSGTIGANTGSYRVYLSDIKMDTNKDWSAVKSIVYSTKATADLVTNTIYDQAFKPRVFTVGRDALKSLPSTTTSATYRYRSVVNTINIANTGIADTFTPTIGTLLYNGDGDLDTTQKKNFVLIAGANSAPYVKNKPIDLSTATVNVTGNVLSITIPSCSVDMANCVLYYTAERSGLAAPTKKVLETVYVKIACNTATTGSAGPWSLGFPDVYRVDNVYVGNTSIGYQDANTAADKTSSFWLNTNQKDDYYGLATIAKKSGIILDAESNLVVKLSRFKKSSLDPDNGFFSVSSYPIDDINTANTSAIQTYNIPSYTSSNNFVYDLRDVIDFRPYAVNTAANSATSANATINPAVTISFNSGSELYIPAPNERLVSDYDYYLARKDYLMIDSSGNIVLKQGTPADNPIPPNDPSSGMVLADINVPEYPSLTWSAATSLNKKRYGISITKRKYRRYTMENIGDISNRIDQLEYYSALSLLETETKDLIVTDQNGLNRFKNGILADNFKDLLGADLTNPDYTAGYNVSTQEILPIFREYSLGIKKDPTINDVNIKYYDNGLTLNPISTRKIIEQPYATFHANTVTNTYVTTGAIQIYPYYDLGKDTIITPEPSGIGEPIYEYSAGGLTLKTTQLVGKKTQTTTTPTSVFDSAYARPQDIRIKVTGLKPKTRYWVFLDGRATNVLPAHYTNGTDITSIASGYGTRDTSEALHGDWQHDTSKLWTESGEMSVLSDSKGEMLAVLYIPPNNLKVGTHAVQVYEASKLPTGKQIATATYIAYTDGSSHGVSLGDNVTTNGAGQEVPMAPISFTTGTATKTTVVNVNDSIVCDHLSQTFTIKRTMSKDSVIKVDSVDLYFKSKPVSTTGRGVTIKLCQTSNGQPNPNDILASKYLHNSEIFVSDTGATKTAVSFDNLVVLKTDATYGIIVIVDGHDPDLAIWVAKSGDKDIVKQVAVTADSFTGSLYTSTNGLAWTPNSGQNIKFTVYSNEYAKTGTAYLTNSDHEFLTITPTGVTYVDNKGHIYGDSFKSDELIVKITANLTATIATSLNSYTITPNTNLTGTFGPGDWLGYWAVGANSNIVVDVAKVVSSNTTSIVLDRTPMYANTAANVFKTVVGSVSYYNKTENILHLVNSSSGGAASAWKFANSDLIRGVKSSCTANIDSVDALQVSSMQPKIQQYSYTNTDTKYILDFIAGPAPSYNRIPINQAISLQNDIPYHKYFSTIPSTSLETEQKFRFEAQLTNTNSVAPYDSTTIFNYKTGLINVFENIINNDSTDENLPIGGNAKSKYITKSVTLAENLDADDLKVYLTAYRPSGANIEVYARFKNKSDPRPFNEIEWTKLSLKDSSNLTSSVSDLFDYREFEYYMPSGSILSAGAGAILDSANDDKLSYKDPDGALYISYKYFSIKIVLLAEAHNVVPKIKNLRAIALT